MSFLEVVFRCVIRGRNYKTERRVKPKAWWDGLHISWYVLHSMPDGITTFVNHAEHLCCVFTAMAWTLYGFLCTFCQYSSGLFHWQWRWQWQLTLPSAVCWQQKIKTCPNPLKIGGRSPMVPSDMHAKFGGADSSRNKKIVDCVIHCTVILGHDAYTCVSIEMRCGTIIYANKITRRSIVINKVMTIIWRVRSNMKCNPLVIIIF